jgi:hypothetical protein
VGKDVTLPQVTAKNDTPEAARTLPLDALSHLMHTFRPTTVALCELQNYRRDHESRIEAAIMDLES